MAEMAATEISHVYPMGTRLDPRGRLQVASAPGRGTAIELRLDRDLWVATDPDARKAA